jgi:NADPH-dependent 2,4-dienoyl-CoA reductase/sulfur reductase-like enzyme
VPHDSAALQQLDQLTDQLAYSDPEKRMAAPHVLIVGGGVGGLATAKALGRAPVEITLIDR